MKILLGIIIIIICFFIYKCKNSNLKSDKLNQNIENNNINFSFNNLYSYNDDKNIIIDENSVNDNKNNSDEDDVDELDDVEDSKKENKDYSAYNGYDSSHLCHGCKCLVRGDDSFCGKYVRGLGTVGCDEEWDCNNCKNCDNNSSTSQMSMNTDSCDDCKCIEINNVSKCVKNENNELKTCSNDCLNCIACGNDESSDKKYKYINVDINGNNIERGNIVLNRNISFTDINNLF